MENEIFIDAIGFENIYEVSNYGRVRSKKYNRFIHGTISESGYVKLTLQTEDKAVIRKAHRIIYYSFYPNTCKNMQINHIDRDKTNNAISNLEAVSSRENNSHKNMFLKKTSKYVGVSWATARKAWRVSITINGKRKFLGHFDDEIEARNAYLNYLNKYNLKNKYAL